MAKSADLHSGWHKVFETYGLDYLTFTEAGWPHYYLLRKGRPAQFIFLRSASSRLTPMQTHFAQTVQNVWVLTDTYRMNPLAGAPNWRGWAARTVQQLPVFHGTRDRYESSVIHAVRQAGLWFFQTTPSIYEVGVPDLLVGNSDAHWWLEVKTGDAGLRETQERVFRRFTKAGVRYHVVRDPASCTLGTSVVPPTALA